MTDLMIPGLQAEIAHARRAVANCQVLIEKLCAIPNPSWTLLMVISISRSDRDKYREYLAALETLARNPQLSTFERRLQARQPAELEAEVERILR